MSRRKKKDYYKILNVDEDATDDEIKRAYRRLAKRFHPDLNKDEGARNRFIEIKEAYDTLIDPIKRKRYDTYKEYGNEFDFRRGPFSGFEEIFQSIFNQNAKRRDYPPPPDTLYI